MNTESFLRKVLPTSGLKVLAELVQVPGQARPGWRYQTFEDFGAMAEAVTLLDGRGATVYHACNAFGGWYVDGERKRIRTQRNVVACRSLYDDIDIGKEGCYASRNEALAHIKAFLAATKLPTPLIVSSGGGIHLYWPLDNDIPPADWQRLSELKRAAAAAFGLKTDAAIGTDAARVLRPVGSTWRKAGTVPVTLKLDAGPYNIEQIEAALSAYLATQGASVKPVPVFAGLEVTNDLAARDYPPSSLAVVAEHCAQVRAMRDTLGDVSYEHWRGVVGLSKYCSEDITLVTHWTSKRGETGHSQTDVKVKYDTWSTGPTTCEFFRAANPAGCQGCPHQVKSPIMLGHTAVAEAPVVTPIMEESLTLTESAEPTTPAHWPRGYRYSGGMLSCFVEGEEEDEPGQWRSFAQPLFYPLERVKLDDDTYALRCAMQVKERQAPRLFTLPTKSVVDGKALRVSLGAYEISVFNDKLAVKYMSDYLTELRKATEERYTFRQFGWKDDFSGFLIGDKLISKAGVSTVRISDSIHDDRLHRSYEVKGTPEEWVEGVNTLYNCENGEPYQYTICTVFGSLLAPLLGYEEWSGIPLALTSEDSGYGKSTISKIAINALCNSSATTVGDCTPYAVLKRASNMKNLCVLFDEVTRNLRERQDAAGMSDILYALSNGRGRVRLGSDGAEKKPDPPWCLMSILTGNRNILFNLTESKINPEAAQMRVFEVDMQSYPPLASMSDTSETHAEHQEIAMHLINNVTGVLAQPTLLYILNHMPEVQDALRKTTNKVLAKLGAKAAKERFYAYHVACTLVGGLIAQKLGFIRFDLNRVKHWAMNHILRLRRETEKNHASTEDQFAALLADLHGTIIVTKAYDGLNARHNKTELPLVPVRSPISGRLVLGTDTEPGRLFLSVRAIDAWCREKSTNPHAFRKKLEAHRYIKRASDSGRADKLILLSRGVPSMPTGQTRCLEFVFDAAQGYVEEHVNGEN